MTLWNQHPTDVGTAVWNEHPIDAEAAGPRSLDVDGIEAAGGGRNAVILRRRRGSDVEEELGEGRKRPANQIDLDMLSEPLLSEGDDMTVLTEIPAERLSMFSRHTSDGRPSHRSSGRYTPDQLAKTNYKRLTNPNLGRNTNRLTGESLRAAPASRDSRQGTPEPVSLERDVVFQGELPSREARRPNKSPSRSKVGSSYIQGNSSSSSSGRCLDDQPPIHDLPVEKRKCLYTSNGSTPSESNFSTEEGPTSRKASQWQETLDGASACIAAFSSEGYDFMENVDAAKTGLVRGNLSVPVTKRYEGSFARSDTGVSTAETEADTHVSTKDSGLSLVDICSVTSMASFPDMSEHISGSSEESLPNPFQFGKLRTDDKEAPRSHIAPELEPSSETAMQETAQAHKSHGALFAEDEAELSEDSSQLSPSLPRGPKTHRPARCYKRPS